MRNENSGGQPKIQSRGKIDIYKHSFKLDDIYYISKLDLGFALLIATICKYNEGKILHLKIVQQYK